MSPECSCKLKRDSYSEEHDKSCPLYMTWEEYTGKKQLMTKQEFEDKYTNGNRVQMQLYRALGLDILPCQEGCPVEDCEGWSLQPVRGHLPDLEEFRRLLEENRGKLF